MVLFFLDLLASHLDPRGQGDPVSEEGNIHVQCRDQFPLVTEMYFNSNFTTRNHMLMFIVTHSNSRWPLWSNVSLGALRSIRSLGARHTESEREEGEKERRQSNTQRVREKRGRKRGGSPT